MVLSIADIDLSHFGHTLLLPPLLRLLLFWLVVCLGCGRVDRLLRIVVGYLRVTSAAVAISVAVTADTVAVPVAVAIAVTNVFLAVNVVFVAIAVDGLGR